tara:strand:- start:661 stop:897 length:237 start_codon:yes stop_codon:yes gene_type:complete
MSDPLFDPEDDAATPLEPEEREQLIPTYITVRAELNKSRGTSLFGGWHWDFLLLWRLELLPISANYPISIISSLQAQW